MDDIKTITTSLTVNAKTKEYLITGALILVPLLLSGPQLLIGTTVNFLLYLTAATTGKKSWLIKATLPSLATIIHGVIFGAITPFLFYLWPVISVGNWIFMQISRSNLKTPAVVKMIAGAIVKMLLLTAGAALLFRFGVIPAILVKSMGIVQLLTATVGGLLAMAVVRKEDGR
ncbi:MAG TPA: hypothetical protein VF828_02445 [Patescibacteria group bacterium]